MRTSLREKGGGGREYIIKSLPLKREEDEMGEGRQGHFQRSLAISL